MILNTCLLERERKEVNVLYLYVGVFAAPLRAAQQCQAARTSYVRVLSRSRERRIMLISLRNARNPAAFHDYTLVEPRSKTYHSAGRIKRKKKIYATKANSGGIILLFFFFRRKINEKDDREVYWRDICNITTRIATYIRTTNVLVYDNPFFFLGVRVQCERATIGATRSNGLRVLKGGKRARREKGGEEEDVIPHLCSGTFTPLLPILKRFSCQRNRTIKQQLWNLARYVSYVRQLSLKYAMLRKNELAHKGLKDGTSYARRADFVVEIIRTLTLIYSVYCYSLPPFLHNAVRHEKKGTRGRERKREEITRGGRPFTSLLS